MLFEPYQPRKHIPLDCNGSTRTSAIVMGTNQDHSHSFIPWQQKHYINPSNAMRCSHALYNTDAKSIMTDLISAVSPVYQSSQRIAASAASLTLAGSAKQFWLLHHPLLLSSLMPMMGTLSCL
ncbi:conserved hypothetical protein [Xylella fastidiosa Temecula1]|uniref:Uncharacterized protein n=1 Tax=Xylella fastidiosa (strain Temecula1 / ATCC 700964) TaxID=183190 RepID=Q87CD1_XYLFT|nr:conserved hypothetical protein [Xylella fastidiosa Temecula1]